MDLFSSALTGRDFYLRRLSVLFFLVVAPLLHSQEASLLDQKQVTQLATEACQRVVEVYEASGIEGGIKQAELEYDQFVSLESTGGYREKGTKRATYELYLKLWKEAQTRTGRFDANWALELYLLVGRRGGHGVDRKSSPRSGPLATNIFLSLRRVGRLGDAHTMALRMEEFLRTRGIEARTELLPDLGPWRSEVPQIRNRSFPISSDENKSSLYKDGFYNFVYFQTLKSVAGQAMTEGDWLRAGELYLWIQIYTNTGIRDEMTTYAHATMQWEADFADANIALARIFTQHGAYQVALELLEDVIERDYQSYAGAGANRAAIKRELLLVKLGQSDPASLDRMAVFFEHHKNNDFVSAAGIAAAADSYIELLRFHGEQAQALELLEAASVVIGDNAISAQMTLLGSQIDLMLDQEQTEGVEDLLFQSLEYYRSRGMKMVEPELYEKYARLEVMREDYQAAMALQGEAQRLYAAMKLVKDRDSAAVKLSEYTAMLSNASAAGDVGGRSFESVDLQPLSMVTESLPEQLATGCFYLTNPGVAAVTGTLEFSGRIDDVVQLDAYSWRVALSPKRLKHVEQRTVTIAADRQITISLECAEPSTEDAFQITWREGAVALEQAKWYYSTGDEAVARSVINASMAESNPFYLVPVFHAIQRSDTLVDVEHVNVRIVASAACRIELFDQETGQLLYVDANGDGVFDAAGDLILVDDNQDGKPDSFWANGVSLKNLEFYFTPLVQEGNSTQDEPLQFEFQLESGGSWETQAIDVIQN